MTMSIDKQIHDKLGLIVILIVAVQLVTLGLMLKNYSLLSETKKSVTIIKQEQATIAATAIGASAQASSERVVVDAVGSVVYIPELRIKLPLNDVTRTIAYDTRSFGANGKPATNPDVDVSSAKYLAPQSETRINCSDFVRLKLEPNPSPYSPHEKPTSVQLSDGRTLQVYESINEKECVQSWAITISPSTLANEFKNAQSY